MLYHMFIWQLLTAMCYVLPCNAVHLQVIQGMMLYPTKLVIPILDDVDVHTLAHPAPTGVLQLQVVSAIYSLSPTYMYTCFHRLYSLQHSVTSVFVNICKYTGSVFKRDVCLY
jgi:hypothetical protein